MRKFFAAGALALLLLSGCASIGSGKIVDKVRQGSQFRDGKDVCRFWLENDRGTRGWLEVDCDTTFQKYEVGEHYPRS